jgi:TRAP-type mannitol/chloroaromatic compound transport system substrate-binding protein
MRSKGYITTSFLCFLIFLLCGLLVQNTFAASHAVKLKLWSAWPSKMDPSKPGLEMLIDMINEKGADAHISVNYIGGPEVFAPTQGCESLQKGIIDMAYTAGAYNTGVVPEADAIKLMASLPWEDRDSGAFDLMNKWHNTKGLEFLARASSGQSFQGFLNDKRTTPDLKGLTMRIVPIYKPLIEPLGAKAVMTAGGEVYTALERGTVDGFWWGGRDITPWAWNEVCKYIWGPGFWTVDVYVMMNKDKWNSLSKEQQTKMTEIFEFYEVKTYAAQIKSQKNITKQLIDGGMDEIKFSPQDREWYLEMTYKKGWQAAIDKSDEVKKLRPLVSE